MSEILCKITTICAIDKIILQKPFEKKISDKSAFF